MLGGLLQYQFDSIYIYKGGIPTVQSVHGTTKLDWIAEHSMLCSCFI